MLEVLSKFSSLFKASCLPIFLMTFSPVSQFAIKEASYHAEDEVPGDNFPYAVMSQSY